MRCADIALYEVKMRGKNGCMAYREGERIKSRAKLGFAVKDIIDNLPGAFIVYRAAKENDEILLANSELLRLTGCKNMDEPVSYTHLIDGELFVFHTGMEPSHLDRHIRIERYTACLLYTSRCV